MVLGMYFLSLNNVDVEFAELGKLIWRSYIFAEALLTTSWVELIDKKKFAKAAINENSKTFVVHLSALHVTQLLIYLSRTV